ncbi:hypothetical protein [Fuscovulum blasticum]|uniref:hypothetical protein n=1 Tax=Fuscovulum blasticum TaxID=1075 RepID=UPI000D3EB0E0|nr:hypothetical protein [Fuscovulum blasticum]AWD20684.1 hypothetical protein B6K69_02615 [Fuscovulum blasticum]
MSFIQELADALARDVLAAQDELGDDRYYEQMAQVLLAASPTLQEAFMTSVRIRLAERRGRDFLNRTLKARREGGSAPKPPRDAGAA